MFLNIFIKLLKLNVRSQPKYIILWSISMAPIKILDSQAHSINLYMNIRSKVMKCCANIYFNRQYIAYIYVYLFSFNMKSIDQVCSWFVWEGWELNISQTVSSLYCCNFQL